MEETTNFLFSCIAFLLSFSFFAQSEYKHKHLIENCFCTLHISSLSKHLPTAVLFWSWHGSLYFLRIAWLTKGWDFWVSNKMFARFLLLLLILLSLLVSNLEDIKALRDFCQRHTVSCTNMFSKQAKIIFFTTFVMSIKCASYLFDSLWICNLNMEKLWISNGNHIVPQQRWNTRLNINENIQQYF